MVCKVPSYIGKLACFGGLYGLNVKGRFNYFHFKAVVFATILQGSDTQYFFSV